MTITMDAPVPPAEVGRLTPARALELLKEVVAEAGRDHVYEAHDEPRTCTYVVPGGDRPDCIVGRVLHRYGMPIEELQAWDRPTMTVVRVWEQDVTGVRRWMPEATMRLLRAAQSVQDQRHPWGEALDEARRYYRTYKLWEVN